MPLKTGYYYIQNRKQYLAAPEEVEIIPRRVIVLPGGAQETPKWYVEGKGDNKYTITIDKARTRAIEDKVFAVTVEGPEPEVWYIIPDERGGKNSYVITTSERYRGWVAPDEPFGQIMCQELIVGPSFPPFYPPNETFQFSPA
ncbi:serine protease inhibitor [Moniliophthora roreri MCA 2997]|uniref:Serine protease inhibitor n=2 Tax=Moniliophthora roreri TaxID=221103 RepID=V2X2N3_MONRO|nr:serine protease inhibitor [Moniliophthora roreri MCA 2997]KAI3621097.1 serine protease inhibitor [Moniliophthora roreri]